MRNDRWYADLETDNLLEDVTVVWCGVFKSHQTGEVKTFGPDEMDSMLDFMDGIKHVVFHNGISFDIPVLKKLFGYEFEGKVTDTLVLSKLLRPNRRFPKAMPIKRAPHSIEAWGYRVGRGKVAHEDWSQYSEEMLHRCVEDVEILALVYDKLQGEMDVGDWSKAVPMTMKLFTILDKMETAGWLVDQEHMHKSLHMLNHWLKKIDSILLTKIPMLRIIEESKVKGKEEYKYVKKPFIQSGGYSSHVDNWLFKISKDSHEYINMVYDRLVVGPFCRVSFRRTNLNSNQETKDFLLSEGWEPREWNVNDDGEETSPKLSKDDPFDGLSGGIGRLAARRVQCRHRQSTILGWFKVIRPDGRISQRVTGLATTGRAKHQRIVNVPNGEAFFGRWMRQIFTVPDDRVLIGVDSAGCQNRMLAARVGDASFTKTLLEGKKEDKTSIHYVNMRALDSFGITASYGQCKNANYAFMFGAGDPKLGRIITGNNGTTIRKALLSVSAGFKKLVEDLQREWRQNALKKYNKKWRKWEYFNGWLPGLDGRPIYIASEHAILVYVLQSDEAIMMEYAYLYFYDWATLAGYEWGVDWNYVSWNHDEFQIESKPQVAQALATLASHSIEVAGKALHIACPHEGESDIGRTWYDTH